MDILPNNLVNESENLKRILEERLEAHDNSRKDTQDKLHEICEGLRKQIDEFENSITNEMEEKFNIEGNRLQTALNNLRESKSVDDISKAIQKAKMELNLTQSYDLVECNLNDDENVGSSTKESKATSLMIYLKKRYEFKTVRKLETLKLIGFEERKPTNLITSFTDKGKFSLSFTFFSDDELKLLKTVDLQLNLSIKIWEKNSNNEIKIKSNILNRYDFNEHQLIGNIASFMPKSTYYLKMRIEYFNEKLYTQWSDDFVFTIPDYTKCVWKEDPNRGYSYSVDYYDHRIANSNLEYERPTVIGNTPLPPNKITSWDIEILESRKNDGGGFFIGVAPFDIDQSITDSYNKCGWYFSCYTSLLWSGPPHNYRGKEHGPRKKEGEYVRTEDNIGVVMDTTKGELSFALNKVNLGIAYEGIPLDRPLVPCVNLGEVDDSALLKMILINN